MKRIEAIHNMDAVEMAEFLEEGSWNCDTHEFCDDACTRFKNGMCMELDAWLEEEV